MGLDYSGRIEHWYALSLRILTTTDPKPNLSVQKTNFSANHTNKSGGLTIQYLQYCFQKKKKFSQPSSITY